MNDSLTFGDLATLMKSCAGVSVDPAEMESRPAATFEEFGLDSLGLLGVVAALENRRGAPIGPGAESCRTPHEFLALANDRLAA
ncbi:acyl carrier protein [Streptacidiphilus sp. ASG 303]|uniref:acyl carrier protein n=1 Tax=Streptomycetaceae TaxID=2062 RepID=UPI001E2A5B26|nr:acyl carrier protein [Streptacidiphilus sp. ASG 303]MCD0481128.1 acyl carrier protein [Streptacidiphilus sp. ASG 303]